MQKKTIGFGVIFLLLICAAVFTITMITSQEYVDHYIKAGIFLTLCIVYIGYAIQYLIKSGK